MSAALQQSISPMVPPMLHDCSVECRGVPANAPPATINKSTSDVSLALMAIPTVLKSYNRCQDTSELRALSLSIPSRVSGLRAFDPPNLFGGRGLNKRRAHFVIDKSIRCCFVFLVVFHGAGIALAATRVALAAGMVLVFAAGHFLFSTLLHRT